MVIRKKYDSDGAKTPWHRNPQPLMVSLSKTEWQSRIPENVKLSTPDEQSSSETVDKARSTDSRSLNAKLKAVNGEFGEHLRKVEQRMHRAENWRAITAERAHRHSSAEKKKDLKFQINEEVELYRESELDQQREQYFRTLGCEYVSENSTWYSKSETGTVDESGSESLTDLEVDEKYEEDMRSIYDSEQETLSDLHDYCERMHIEDEEDARQYESDIEREEYQSELNA
ncbi:hypothetical protein [Endozoicomonas atrinae]|uniref:hypothetical protein n=1 Tax=Endozoicomonas atrinae TaxID=1333660 RepID=UPI003B00D499